MPYLPENLNVARIAEFVGFSVFLEFSSLGVVIHVIGVEKMKIKFLKCNFYFSCFFLKKNIMNHNLAK